MKKITSLILVAAVIFSGLIFEVNAMSDYELYKAAQNAEAAGNYVRAVQLYKEFIPRGIAGGHADGVLLSQMKVRQLTPIFNVYAEKYTENPPYYGAKFEPVTGVYHGSAYDGNHSEFYPKKQSIRLIYCEFENNVREAIGWHKDVTVGSKTAIIFAWNTYHTYPNIEEYETYIKDSLNYLDGLNIPIYLRIANEMNIGPNGYDSEQYIKTFRYIASLAKEKKNIATVWSPNDIGAIDRPFKKYYPGDEFVDWVGISHYNIKRFRIDLPPDKVEVNDAYFVTGPWANPVLRLLNIVDFMKENNIQKPLMITEGGVEHYRKRQNEDSTQWATSQLHKMYQELPRMFPQLKVMSYFNVEIANENEDFSLRTNPLLAEEYHKIVADPSFISDYGTNAPYWYEKFSGGEALNNRPLNLSSVAYYPKAGNLTVVYRIDDKEVFYGEQSPYNHSVNLRELASGWHKLECIFYADWKVVSRREHWFNVIDSPAVKYSGNPVVFGDAVPRIIEGRTLVPARAMFEVMNADVTWDESASKVTVKRGSNTIILNIGSNIMDVNGEPVEIDISAMILNNRTMVPLRAISQALGAKIEWDGANSTVLITE